MPSKRAPQVRPTRLNPAPENTPATQAAIDQLGAAFERADAQTSRRLDANALLRNDAPTSESNNPSILVSKGRILADGTRRGAGVVTVRKTICFRPDHAAALEALALQRGPDGRRPSESQLVERALDLAGYGSPAAPVVAAAAAPAATKKKAAAKRKGRAGG